MKPWLFRISLSHLSQYPGRTLLGIMGIALGTAVYLSISLAAASAVKSFQAGVAAVAGKAQWRVQSPGAPLDENLFTRLRRLREVKAAAPVVESVLELSGNRGPVLLLGIDPFSEKDFRDYEFDQGGGLADQTWVDFLTRPDAVLVSQRLAARLGLKVGDSLPVLVGPARKNLLVSGIFRSTGGLYPLDGAVVLMDIAAAQELLDRVGRLDYIDLMASGDEAAALARLQGELPPGVEVVRPGAQGTRTEGLVAAYRLNLAVLSAIALFVGMFLIYQSVTLSVVRRRREIGLLRTLGMTPAQVLVLFLAEGLVSGLVGGLLGLILGVGLARGVLGVMTQNLTSLYMPVVAAEVWVRGGLLLQAWGLAVAATLVAAALPAREAARTQLRAVWHREELEERLESRAATIFIWGLAALALAGICASWKVRSGPPWPGFAAAFLILLGFALFAPLMARLLGQGLQGFLQEWPAAEPGLPVSGRVPEPRRSKHRRPGLRPGDAHRGDRDDRLLPANGERLGEPGHQRRHLLRAGGLLHRGLRPVPAAGDPAGVAAGPGDRRPLPLPLRAPALPGPRYPGDRRQLPGAGETRRAVVPAGRDQGDYARGWGRGPEAQARRLCHQNQIPPTPL